MKRIPAFIRRHIISYLLLIPLFIFILLFQVRASVETVHLQRHLDFYIPFLVKPFTDEVSVADHFMSWEQGREADMRGQYSGLRRGDQVLQVNGHPFHGMSVYLRELWLTQHQPAPAAPSFDWRRFVVTVVANDSRKRNIEFGFPHCTCGIPGLWEAIAAWFIAPILCVLVGFAAVALRPSSILAWAYLGLMLSLSQLQFWEEPYTGCQMTVSPMAWTDWLRVPAVGYRAFVQSAWPVALLTGFIQIWRPRRSAYGFAILLVALLLLFAGVRSALDIAWSESFRTFVPLHRLFDEYRT